MLKKGNKLYSIFGFKCPQCHEGDLFESGTYNLKRFTKMKKECPVCGLNYSPEPSFFDGAMYISYAMQVALIITVFVALNVLFEEPPLWIIITLAIGLAILLVPITFRLSKSIFINIFMGYKPDAAKKHKA